jgi:hypothetical protein
MIHCLQNRFFATRGIHLGSRLPQDGIADLLDPYVANTIVGLLGRCAKISADLFGELILKAPVCNLVAIPGPVRLIPLACRKSFFDLARYGVVVDRTPVSSDEVQYKFFDARIGFNLKIDLGPNSQSPIRGRNLAKFCRSLLDFPCFGQGAGTG